ncbi:NACHT, LRR and PYD domains-containing protein 5 [Sciurus carolinensis]|uniref:NACHT, LRR and PYD domains-containing protein 5 n=1 Tax=Sciurus carolinensis TaxID=30640 RepID=A0AA41MFY4_SCICA|nr:NACHT, LRR and PYD domains-containing protein 5 [Sciurus carolinensis]
MEGDQLHTFTNYGLQWSLKELDKEEFSTFKRLLKEKYSELTSCSLPWAEVDAAGPEGLAALLHEYYLGPLAWAVCINILEEMSLLTLAARARDEMKSPGGAEWGYKANVIARFTAELATHPRLQRADDWPEMQALVDAFHADERGFRTRTVVLHGKSGTGKSALARRLMLSWAQGTLLQDPFSYAFFLQARDIQWMRERSFAKMITREWPDSQAPVEEIMSQPERLLFVVDGFDDLVPELCEDDEQLCGDWTKEQPTSILLCSLLRKVLLPESSLLVTVTDAGVEKLKSLLQCPRYLMVGGMSLERRTQLLLDHITDDPCRTQLLHSVVDGHRLLDQCQVPTVCLLLGTALQLGRSVAPLCRTLTGLYAAFLFHQLRPREPLPRCLNQGERRALKGLCQMAAEGVWAMRSVFYTDSLSMYRLQVARLSALFHMDILLQEDRGGISYTFLHPSLQEFCAALFYLLEGLDRGQGRYLLFLDNLLQDLESPPPTALGSHLLWMKRFLFGLMSKDVLKELEALLGCPVPLAVRPRLQRWVSLLAPQAATATPRDLLDAFHCLFETQDEKFVRSALSDFQEVRLPINQRMDLMAASFCLQHCQRLRKIQLDVRDLFSRSELAQVCPAAPRGPLRKALVDEWWESFCTVLGTHPNLRQLDLGNSVLNKWAMKTLCVTLRRPTCKIRSLIFKGAEVTPGLQYLWMTLIVNRNLRRLDLGGTALREEEVKVACQALCHPSCQLEALRLDSCGLTHACYPVISQMLTAATSLKSLSLARNKVTDEGLAPLCAALWTSQCTLAELTLDTCGLTAAGCKALASALASSCSLTHLCLCNNQLGSDGVSLLCRPLRLPDCALQRLILNQCHLDVASCGFLALALVSSPRLTHLSLSANPLGDSGVKLLCEALQDPSCCLQDLELVSGQLTAACCESLSCVITKNKHLQSLDLAANALGDGGVMALCKGLQQPGSALRRLGLEACRLTTGCCEALSAALTCRGRLTSLNLVCNNFSPAGIALLCSAFAQPSCSLRTIGSDEQAVPGWAIVAVDVSQTSAFLTVQARFRSVPESGPVQARGVRMPAWTRARTHTPRSLEERRARPPQQHRVPPDFTFQHVGAEDARPPPTVPRGLSPGFSECTQFSS